MPSWKKLLVSGSDATVPSVSTTADFTIDAGGDIILDADGTDILLKDGGTEFGRFKIATSDFVIKSAINNKDILFKGVDNTATITALKLDMSESGDAYFNNDISGSTIRASGDIIAFNSSDERLKDNITYIHRPLDKISKIGGYEFDWKELTEEEKKTQHSQTGHSVGVIAQEIQDILPDMVTEESTGCYSVNPDNITWYLVNAVKELSKKITELESKIEE